MGAPAAAEETGLLEAGHRRRRLLALAAVLVLAFAVRLGCAFAFRTDVRARFLLDMSVYDLLARHLANGKGYVGYLGQPRTDVRATFLRERPPAGERVEGYTTPSWIALLAGLRRLDAPLLGTARVLGIASGTAPCSSPLRLRPGPRRVDVESRMPGGP